MNAQRHSVYWFDDGCLVLHVQDIMYKVHGSLLKRHSPYLASVGVASNTTAPPNPIANEIGNGVSYVFLGSESLARPKDVEALLEHMYHDFPLGRGSSLDRVFSVLRSSSPQQLNFPTVHTLAKEHLAVLFTPKTSSQLQPEHLREGLLLARDFGLPHVERAVLYQIMTSANLDAEDQDAKIPEHTFLNQASSSSSAALGNSLSPSGCERPLILVEADKKLCQRLMTRVIEHFTPILFTPPTTPHMPCTDVFADTWMALVIQPAIDDGGVYKPIETLERIKEIDWAKEGLCSACVVEKREEWTGEQDGTWNLVGEWLKDDR